METKDLAQLVMGVAIVLIGLFMVVKFVSNIPPLLSGIAFILIGAGKLLRTIKD